MKRSVRKWLSWLSVSVLLACMVFSVPFTVTADIRSSIEIDGVEVEDGEYLREGSNSATSSKPASDYAYYKNGVLYLYDYERNPSSSFGTTDGLEIYGDAVIELHGENTLNFRGNTGISAENLTIRGDGKLSIFAYKYILARQLTIEGGTVECNGSGEKGVSAYDGDLNVKGGALKVKVVTQSGHSTNEAIYVGGNLNVSGGNLSVEIEGTGTVSKNAVFASGDMSVSAGTLSVNAEKCDATAIKLWGNATFTGGTTTVVGNTGALEVWKNMRVSGGAVKLSTVGMYDVALTISDTDTPATKSTYTQSGGDVEINANLIGLYAPDSVGIGVSGGELTVTTTVNDDFGVAIRNGSSVNLTNGEVVINSAGYGILTPDGTVSLSNKAYLQVTAARNAVECHTFTIGTQVEKVLLSSTDTAADASWRALVCQNATAVTTAAGSGSQNYDGSNPVSLTHENFVSSAATMDYIYYRPAEIFINNIPMAMYDYLTGDGLAASTYRPEDDYAHLDLGGVTRLDLVNFDLVAADNAFGIYSTSALYIYVSGDCFIVTDGAAGIRIENNNVVIGGSGQLTVNTKNADGIVVVNGNYYQTDTFVAMDVHGGIGLNVPKGDVNLTSRNLTVTASDDAVRCRNFTTEESKVLSKSSNGQAISYSGTFAYGTQSIRAAKERTGTLGVYNASEHATYKYIRIGEHFHVGVEIPATESTCVTEGKKAYYKCDCGDYFEEATCDTRIHNLPAWGNLPLGDHTYDNAADTDCNVCGATRAMGLLGDVNNSGTVDSTDARLVLQYAVEKIDATKLNLSVADVNGSGAVDSTDARLILQYAVKKISKFPAA